MPPPSSARPYGPARFLPPPYAVLALRAARGVEGGRRVRRSTGDLKLRRLGFRVVRVSAELVLSNLPAAIALVRAAL